MRLSLLADRAACPPRARGADLKFLHKLPRGNRNFKSKSAARILGFAGGYCFPKFVGGGAAATVSAPAEFKQDFKRSRFKPMSLEAMPALTYSEASTRFRKFVSHRGNHLYELPKAKGTSKLMIQCRFRFEVRLFDV
jgi:hypothetical protein